MHPEYILRLIWVISPLDQFEISSSSFKESLNFEYDPQNHFHNKSVSKSQMDPGKRVSRKNCLNLVSVVQPCCASCTEGPLRWVWNGYAGPGDSWEMAFPLPFFSLFLPFSPFSLPFSPLFLPFFPFIFI